MRVPTSICQWQASACALGLLLMCAGFFLFPDYGGIARSFYLLQLLPLFTLLLLAPTTLRMPLPGALAFLALPAWLALSTAWSQPPAATPATEYWDLVKPLLFLAALLAACQLALQRYPRLPLTLVQVLTVAGLASAALSLGRYLPDALASGQWPRLAGISLRGDINVTAALQGLNCLFCAWGLQHWSRPWRLPLLCSLAGGVAVALLSQSKIPLLLALAALGWLLLAHLRRKRRLRWALGAAALLIGALTLFFAGFDRVPFLHRSEGYSVRLDLWGQALRQIAAAPWIGHGLGTELGLTRFDQPYHSHTHNFVLGAMRYGGLVALLLLLAQLGTALWALRRAGFLPLGLWWLAGVLFLLTNGGQPLVKPHHTWFFYWIPLALLLARGQKPSTLR